MSLELLFDTTTTIEELISELYTYKANDVYYFYSVVDGSSISIDLLIKLVKRLDKDGYDLKQISSRVIYDLTGC